jgi:formylglycine-generating enzyme required for sulfatase activity
LPSFYIDKYEVTNKLYRTCVDKGECTQPHSLSSSTRADYFENPEFDDYPVIFVTWQQAKTYCAWRNALLPSEAQWEKAARGTTEYIYPWGNEIDGSYANYDGAFRRDTSKVGSYETGKSMYGVYDMVGNVWEWVSSLYMPYPYRVDERENPNTPGERVVRGGSWYDHTAGLRSTDRYGDGTEDANDGLGFRCAREAYP